MTCMKPEMPSSALVELLSLFDAAGILVWLDGGWGVDALLGTQTRPHKDADIIVALVDVPRLQEALAQRAFAFARGTPPHSFVLADGRGLEVDIHAAAFDEEGNGVYRMESGDVWIYPAVGFTGRGVVAGTSVRCLSPAAQVLCHAHGYEPGENDFRDMELLAQRFGVALPQQLLRSRS